MQDAMAKLKQPSSPLMLGIFVITTSCLIAWLGSVGFAQTIQERYERQGRCGQQAAEVFKADYGQQIMLDQEGTLFFNYRNHYNAALNKCFFLEITKILGYRAKTPYSATMYRLYDIDENKEYGSFYKRSDATSPADCQILGKLCASEAEWELLIKRFMED
jgi:hypothetical protein